MNFEFHDNVDMDELNNLAKQKVDIDDWDYMIFFEAKFISKFPEGWSRFSIEPDNYSIQRLLSGSADNRWYLVEDFMGKKGFLGVAYHA